MASVTVRGSAQLSVAPDQAFVDLGITVVALNAGAAMDEIARRSHHLTTILEGLGFDPARWSTHGVSVQEEWEWKDNTNTLVGHRANAGVLVDVDDLHRIPPLLQAAVDDAGAQVRSVDWRVSSGHPAHHALLGAAALDAQRRAIAYTVALGLMLGQVEEISDVPLTAPLRSDGPMMMRAAKSADAAPAMSLSGGEIALSATVYVRFTTMPRT